ncbi:MAG TPA: molecular chaperone DnaJ [Rhizobiales bacterium]|nr:molecular chaperone DnaJ [Hyphomicrobiales bacterium]
MPNLLFAALILALIYFGIRHLASANPRQLAGQLRKIGGVVAIIVSLILTLRGGAVIAAPVFLFGLGLLGLGHLVGMSSPFGGKSPGQKSSVRTKIIEMELDHDSAAMEGAVLAGRFAGKKLSELDLSELFELYELCRKSPDQSARLLEAYLDHAHPGWRDQYGGDQTHKPGSSPATEMTRNEALQILGLDGDATRKQVIAAHRRLMKRYHPDAGGSDYLAAKINEAKDLLLAGSS